MKSVIQRVVRPWSPLNSGSIHYISPRLEDCESISDPLLGLRWAVGSRDLCNELSLEVTKDGQPSNDIFIGGKTFGALSGI